MFIAKMHTRYPEYHGTGYYNFIIEDNEEELQYKIEEYSHDFQLQKIVETKHQNVQNIIKQFPTKEKLNVRYFEV